MPCCCERILNLCDVPICETLELNELATGSSGENIYKLVLDFLNITVTVEQSQTEGQNIVFDVSGLNENYQYTGQIFDADGNKITINVGGIEYDCIKFKTVANVTV